MTWTGRVAPLEDIRNAYRILVRKFQEEEKKSLRNLSVNWRIILNEF
jgi:hypothetical protein